MEHGGDPDCWEFIPFSVPWHQESHPAEQTVCGCLSRCKKREKMGKCRISGQCQVGSRGEQSLVVVAAQPPACPSLGVPGVGWELWDGGQAPPGLVAAPEVQHSWFFLWLPHSQHFPCALLRSPQLLTACTVNPWISHLLGFRSLFPFQTVTVSGLSPSLFPQFCSSILFLCCLYPPIPRTGVSRVFSTGKEGWCGQRGSMRSWPGKLRKFWDVSPLVSPGLSPQPAGVTTGVSISPGMATRSPATVTWLGQCLGIPIPPEGTVLPPVKPGLITLG